MTNSKGDKPKKDKTSDKPKKDKGKGKTVRDHGVYIDNNTGQYAQEWNGGMHQ